MNRRAFLGLAGTSLAFAIVPAYLYSDRRSIVRGDMQREKNIPLLHEDEREIIYLASLAPSGHNTQPWKVKYVSPLHWIICNDDTKWLPAVDPEQRETILSIGAFLQNVEYAAGSLGYVCAFRVLAKTNQQRDVVEVKLERTGKCSSFDIQRIKLRRTVRSGYEAKPIENKDLAYILGNEKEYAHFFPNYSKEFALLNERTIAANDQQSRRDDAQSELANYIRFSSKDAREYRDGLTTASMEIDGIRGWVLRNFYGKEDVMSKTFREQGIEKIKAQVSRSGGWLLMTSKDGSTTELIEAGKRLERILLRIRDRNIAIHPMTQILEETPFKDEVGKDLGIADPIQFVLRLGYIKEYPAPVSLRKRVEDLLE